MFALDGFDHFDKFRNQKPDALGEFLEAKTPAGNKGSKKIKNKPKQKKHSAAKKLRNLKS